MEFENFWTYKNEERVYPKFIYRKQFRLLYQTIQALNMRNPALLFLSIALSFVMIKWAILS